MRQRLPRVLALPAAAALLLLTAAPATAQTIPTTPIPDPANPGQPPMSAPIGPQPLGKAVGDAGAALGVLRLLPNAVPTSAILPGAGELLPKQSALEAGMGLSSAQANSEAYLSYEKSIAQSSPFGLSAAGNAPQTPGSLVQTALPDNPKPISGGLNAPKNPLFNLGLLNGQAHARWSPTLGPCVGTISDSSTSIANLALLPTIPNIPGADQLTQASDQLKAGLGGLPGPLANLGGLLSGTSASADGKGAVLSLPNTLSSRSVVRLVDIPGSKNKAVESTSTLQAANIELLKGTPLGLTIKVASQPTLRVTSTGDKKTSKVEYSAPVLQIVRGDKVLFTLDANNPTKDIPIGIPLPSLKQVPGFDQLKNVPVIGGLAEMLNGATKQLPGGEAGNGLTLDIGVLKLSIAGLNQKSSDMTSPFKGFQMGASARLLDLQILPTTALQKALPPDAAKKLPSSLAQVSLGEQIARAYAPTGGVECGTAQAPPAGNNGGAAPKGPVKNLAYTNAAYDTVPMFWSGTAMLLIGVVLVAAMPGRRRLEVVPVAKKSPGFKPSPRPRSLDSED
ncbi:hypothetical protein DMC61_35550 [Amycolatopsis sp. WAC 04169]|uniref:hypothetical protein n=1 Tax=Amycolatopsis sp. WAC 04169 TaxID=2203197 RepID=UPI000F7A83E3|nr:hypothetical protein [Amycolatopsis sp. WAC 04169]RSN21718.1 hypothetical protein DMC61_35550 [Amycolatopsis sp. WAC 04169]